MRTSSLGGSAAVGYLTLVRGNPDFRNLWFGQIVSLFGDWFNLIASAALVAQLTASGFAVGGLFLVRMLAPFLVSPLAGVAADRYNRKGLLIFADLTRALAVMGFLLVRGPGQIGLLYTLTAFQMGLSGLFFPTRNAILPDLVDERELGAANAISSTTWSVMLALGAAIGGVATGQWGIYQSFVIDSLTFLVSAALIARVGYRPNPALEGAEVTVGAALKAYRDGLVYLKRNPDILAISLHKMAIGLTVAGGAYSVVIVAMAERVFVLGEGGGTSLGIMYAVAGVGTGLGPVLVRRLTGDREGSLRLTLAIAYGCAGLGMFVTASLTSFELVLLGMLVRALGVGLVWVFSNQLLLQLVPGEVRGRVFATEFALFTLASATSSAVGGWLLDASPLGIPGLLQGMGWLVLLPGALWSLWIAVRRGSQASVPS